MLYAICHKLPSILSYAGSFFQLMQRSLSAVGLCLLGIYCNILSLFIRVQQGPSLMHSFSL